MTDFITKTMSIRGHEFKIACLETMKCHASWFTYEDEAEVRDRDWNIQEGDVVFDIGAGHGSYTMTALALGAAHVFSWCPQGRKGEPSEAEFLSASLKLNGWEDRATIVPGGLWSEVGVLHEPTQKFYPGEGVPASLAILESYEWLKVTSFDNWFSSTIKKDSTAAHLLANARAIWMKIDVEGAEAQVLIGARDFIHMFLPLIQVENHPLKNAAVPFEVRAVMGAIGGYRLQHNVAYHSVTHSFYVGVNV